jgi:DNA polymerase-1
MVTFLIIDGNNISFRASSVIPPSRLINDDINTGLLWGMLRKRTRIITEETDETDVVPIFTFDAEPDPTVNNDAVINRYSFDNAYKANRKDTGDDPARTELDKARAAWRGKWINEIMDQGYPLVQYPYTEADDIIAYISERLSSLLTGNTIGIWTMDKDLMQCVNDDKHVCMYRYSKGSEVTVDEQEVIHEKGLPASKIRMQLALQGDSADNYPRVKGYGGKRGLALLNQADSIDDIIAAIPEYEDQLRFNWTLAGIGKDYMPTSAIKASEFALEHIINKPENQLYTE